MRVHHFHGSGATASIKAVSARARPHGLVLYQTCDPVAWVYWLRIVGRPVDRIEALATINGWSRRIAQWPWTLVHEPFHRDGCVDEEKVDGCSAATRGYVAKDEERFYVGGRTRAWVIVKVPG